MKIVKTAKFKILTHTKTFDETIEIYNSALSFYILVCEKEYSNLKNKISKEKVNYIEALSHRTKENIEIKYDFDKDFYKFPSYLRRAVIMEAMGIVRSFSHNSKESISKNMVKP